MDNKEIFLKNLTVGSRVSYIVRVRQKAISARVYGNTYTQFKKICDAKGLTANACLNMLIADFVRENKTAIE